MKREEFWSYREFWSSDNSLLPCKVYSKEGGVQELQGVLKFRQ